MSFKRANFCQSFRDRAREVQRDMDDALSLGIARNEDTITESLLLNLARNHPSHELNIKSFTRSAEGINGADWEFWISNGNGLGIALRVQAKRLFPSGKYESLFHQSKTQVRKSTNQCRELIKNAGSSIPIYVFYNSLFNFRLPLSWTYQFLGCHSIFDWGISMCGAYTVEDAIKRKCNKQEFLSMVPWHYLVCAECCSDKPNQFDLPTIVGNSLRLLFEADDGAVHEPYNFQPNNNPPNWVKFLKEPDYTNNSILDEYMLEFNLRGIVIMEQTI